MTVLEIGRDARIALASATRCDVVMSFSRGQVVQTDRDEIVWFDCDPEAFSPRGVLTGPLAPPFGPLPPSSPSPLAPSTGGERGGAKRRGEGTSCPGEGSQRIPHPPSPDAPPSIGAAFERERARFLAALRRGTPIREAAPLLLGLGPGLTPSGDDFLGGFLAALHHIGRPAAVDTTNTHAISRARLAMHMRGEGTRAEVRFVRALVGNQPAGDVEETLKRHGYSSGEDFMSGTRAALELR